MSSWFLDQTLPTFVAEECGVDQRVAAKVVDLYQKGNEVAYVARYRGDAHEGMSCDQLRSAFETFNAITDLNKKVEKALNTVKTKIENPTEQQFAARRLAEATCAEDVLEITQALTSARKTKADKARELGLEKAAKKIMKGNVINLHEYVDKRNEDLSSIEKVNSNVVYLLADMINRLPESIDFAKSIATFNYKVKMDVVCELTSKAKKWKEGEGPYHLIKHFSNYVDFRKRADYVQHYEILAMERAKQNEVLTWKIEIGTDILRLHPANDIRIPAAHKNLFTDSIRDSVHRLFEPKIKRMVQKRLITNAENAAIVCFSNNLRQLFSQENVSDKYVVALDPGFGQCKAAFISNTGEFIEAASFDLKGTAFDSKGNNILERWVTSAQTKQVVFAIGNGKASLETQKAVANMIKNRCFDNKDVYFCVVPESGASKYSITPLAEAELPSLPIQQRSAVSIGRRLINPVSEFVKIDPKHLGLGMYQHSVNDKKLSEALDLVVRECVSERGVDVNTASVQLLQHVCGLNRKTAAGIIDYREKNGHIFSRTQLNDVKGLGPKSFEQCAGFLTVLPTENNSVVSVKRQKLEFEPLDITIVHPTQYITAKKLLKLADVTSSNLSELTSEEVERLKAINTINDEEKLVVQLLTAVVKRVSAPPLLKDVRSISSLKVGDNLPGRVSNQVDFGVFVDIGAECAALAHKSVLTKPFPEVGTELFCCIKSIDLQRKRIGVSLTEGLGSNKHNKEDETRGESSHNRGDDRHNNKSTNSNKRRY